MISEELVIPNTKKGEFLWHVWSANHSLYVITQRGTRGSRAAFNALKKELGNIYMDICYSAPKAKINRQFA